MTKFINKILQCAREKYSDTYSANFFISNLFSLSALGSATTPDALTDIILLARGGDYPGEAVAMVTIAVEPAVGGICPDMGSAKPIGGSSMVEGTSVSITVSSRLLPQPFACCA
jgi:hypothetical protein